MLQQLFIYLLKVILGSGLLMLYYIIALRNNKFHYYNRFYLLLSVVLSVFLPLLHLQWFVFDSGSSSTIHLFNIISSTGYEDFNYAAESYLTIQQALFLTVLFASLCLLLRFLFSIIRLYTLKTKYPVNKTADFDFINTDIRQAPFSFLKNIFWRNDISLQTETGKQILQHEITHIKQKHSWDKLFMQIILCFYWMNPFYWLLKRELYLIHEFIADDKALGENDAVSFSKMLLTFQYKNFEFLPAQSFFYSPVKRRLFMLTTSKKPQFSYTRRLMVLPLIAVVVCLFAFTVKDTNAHSSKQMITAKNPFVLVVDAGHGGNDAGAVSNGMNEKDITLKIAQKIKEMSAQYGIDVILTRNSDVYMSPQEKSDFANAQHANAFISLHVNAAENPGLQQSGFEVVLPKNNAQEFSNVLLGSAILQNLQPDFEITPLLQQKRVGIWVLNNSIIPAALIECGYLTNTNDAKLLQDNSRIELIAKDILNGAAAFANNKHTIKPQSITYSDTSAPNLSQTPLYVLDGKIVSKETTDKLDPSAIEQVNVLKDKDATDKYGDKGKYGVVEIISKNKTNSQPKAPPPPPADKLM